MMCCERFGQLASVLRLLVILNAMLMMSVTSGQEASQGANYVTGCLGSDSVMLHTVTSADDVRSVFVYKGGEILGSDIIPAQGDYKDRLRIVRQKAIKVTLSDLRLWDSGVFRIETTTRDSKNSTYVVLVVPEGPIVQENRLHMYRARSSSHQELIRLTCGTFTSLGYPAASVLWLDPDGRLLSSTGYSEGQYLLDLPPSSPAGNYSCLLHCTQPHTCCLPPGDSLAQHTSLHVQTSAGARAKLVSEPTPELTSALQEAGENMAAGMAALVNDQVRGSLDANQRRLQEWEEELEQRMESRFKDMSVRFEKVLEERLEELGGGLDNGAGADGRPDLVGSNKRFETDVYVKMKNSLQNLYQQMDEGRKNMSLFQKKINNKVNSFQRKLKSLRLSIKRHGVFRHDSAIKNLKDTMSEQFRDVNEKLRDFETASSSRSHQPSDDEQLRTFQQRLNEMSNKLNQGEVSLGSFQRSITHKMEDLRDTVTSLEGQLQRHEERHVSSDRERDEGPGPRPDEGINDTKAVLGRTSRPEVSPRQDNHYSAPGERPIYRRDYGDENNGDSGYNAHYNNNDPVSETCLAVKRKFGTGSGVYTLRPDVRMDPQSFYCDMDTEGGGWIVFQRRQDGSEDFFRTWDEYVKGFGDPNGEFWLGLENLYHITSGSRHSLRVDLRTYDNVEGYAFYQHFRVLSSHQKYLMTVSGYSGTAGDGLFVHDNKPFSTWNQDNDQWVDGHCANNYRSAWWYAKCRVCDLNTPYTSRPPPAQPSSADDGSSSSSSSSSSSTGGLMWLYGDDVWGAGKVRFVEMKIRPEQ